MLERLGRQGNGRSVFKLPSMAKKRYPITVVFALVALTGIAIWFFSRASDKTPSAQQVADVLADTGKSDPAVGSAVAPKPANFQASETSKNTPSEATASLAPVANAQSAIPQIGVAKVVTPTTQPAVIPQSAEVRSSRAMYMAHAPLRTPEVADPDSAANRRILQTMVEKALSRQKVAPLNAK